MINNNTWKGVWTARVWDKGKLLSEHTYYNVVTLAFRGELTRFLEGSREGSLAITHQQLGTDNTPANEAQTNLIAPEPDTRQILTSSSIDPNNSNRLIVTAVWGEGEATGTWQEFGLFVNDDILMIRVIIDVEVPASGSLTIDGEITQNIT